MKMKSNQLCMIHGGCAVRAGVAETNAYKEKCRIDGIDMKTAGMNVQDLALLSRCKTRQ